MLIPRSPRFATIVEKAAPFSRILFILPFDGLILGTLVGLLTGGFLVGIFFPLSTTGSSSSYVGL
jgi:hypothetical protein